MMHYDRYFKPGQRLMLRRVATPGAAGASLDCLAAHLISCSEAGFVFTLQDAGVADDIEPGAVYEILGDLYDFGLRLTASFDKPMTNGQIALLPQGDLEFFFRRKYLRVESQLWMGYRRGSSLRVLRQQWESWAGGAAGKQKGPVLPPFSRSKVSLSAGGLGLLLPGPVGAAEVILLFLALDDNRPLICALAEVVRAEPVDSDGQQRTGLQFLNLLDSDRQRIELFVRRELRAQMAED